MSLGLGFFTRLLDRVPAGERYRLATEQIRHAERHGFDVAWVAQHHFHEPEGGLPAPLPFLVHAAARTSRIRLGTGIITLPLDDPIRVAEDAVVTDLLSGGRLELGLGNGGTPVSFAAFGLDHADRNAVFDAKLDALLAALRGEVLGDEENRLYPAGEALLPRLWLATFSVSGAERAGRHGFGLMLSRTQPRPADRPDASLAEIQLPLIEAYLGALPDGATPRISAGRSVLAADDRAEALRFADDGLRRISDAALARTGVSRDAPLAELIRAYDVHLGTADDVLESLAADPVLRHATDLSVQAHSVDPPHEHILRSIELVAARVAPGLGWAPRS